MKKLILLIVVLIGSFQFTKGQCRRVAQFQNGPDISVTGNAILTFSIDGTKTLSFDDTFSTSSGPDLHVYLSQENVVSSPGGILVTPNTIEIGVLKSPTGEQSYDLTNSTPAIDLDSYAYVHVHCKMYDHYWGGGAFAAETGADCGNLSVADVLESEFLIYPTVMQKELIISLKPNRTANLSLYSVIGELIYKEDGLSKEINFIKTESLPKGIYILQVEIEGKLHSQKIIKK